MRMPFACSWVLFLVASLSFSTVLCKHPEASVSPEPLQAIVDLHDVLEEAKPSEFAAINLKNALQQNPVSTPAMRERSDAQASKTSIFNKSMLGFIKKIYNQKSYAGELSQNAGHILQFFDLSNELNLGLDAIYVSTRLFYNKMKAAEVIDDGMIIQLLDATPHYLERHFTSYEEVGSQADLNYVRKHLENMILSKFTSQINVFRSQPDLFVANLAGDLAAYYHEEATRTKKAFAKQEAMDRLRNLLIRFYELALNKIMWNPQQPDRVWSSFTTIAQGLQMLGEYGIVRHMDDLDDLLWSLTNRFCYFLDLAGSNMPLTFYEEMEKDLESRVIYFLEYREQDEGIATKKDLLSDAIMQAKARAIAYEKKGLISAPIFFKKPSNPLVTSTPLRPKVEAAG